MTVLIPMAFAGALLLVSLIGHVSTSRSKNPPAFANGGRGGIPPEPHFTQMVKPQTRQNR